MWSTIWHTFFFDPVYNLLVFFVDYAPSHDVGIAIVAFTIVMKLVLLPLSIKAAHTQHAMRLVEPELNKIREIHKDNREELARQTMAVYRAAGVNPFSGLFLALIQIPVLFALFFAVSGGGGIKLPDINTSLLYSFVPNPGTTNMLFLGMIDMASHSIILALCAGATQYFHGHVSMPSIAPKTTDKPNFKEDLTRSFQVQIKYGMPVIIAVVAYSSAAIALYFFVSNSMSILQELIVNHRIPDRHKPVA